MATPQIVAVSNSYRQQRKQKPIQEDSKYQIHNTNCCNHNSQKSEVVVAQSELKRNRSYCCSTCCCSVLSSDEESFSNDHPQQHTEHLNRKKNIKGQKENYKTIHKAKEVNERRRTMDINRNGSLRNRVSWGFCELFQWRGT